MQLTLFRDRLAAWEKFHTDNPQVYELFVRFALEAKAAGRERFGARVIGERIRWYCNVETKSADGFKANDHFWPYYARLAMLLHPELEGVFETRDARFDASEQDILGAHRKAVVWIAVDQA